MPQQELFIAVDVGTTGARAVAVDLAGRVIQEVRESYETSAPRPGRAEQDPDDWLRAGIAALAGLTGTPGFEAGAVRAVGLTGQCPTVAPFDHRLRPVGPGLLYRDNRAVAEAREMRELLGDELMHARTGHLAAAFHVGPKLLWLRRFEPARFNSTSYFLQPRDLIAHALTGRVTTDQTHASTTLCFDLRQREWADDCLEAFQLDRTRFATVLAPWDLAGEISGAVGELTGLPVGCPVVIGAADSQCAAFGSGVVTPGPISEMAGASSCLNSTVIEPLADLRVTHYSQVVPDCYSTELGVNTSGAALAWTVQQLRFQSYEELSLEARSARERIARTPGGDARRAAPLFLPYLGDGERDDASLLAAFIGLSARHTRAEIAYAVLEGIAFEIMETVSTLRTAGAPLDELRVAGGGARLASLGQIKADLLGCPILHMAHDSASVGVAMLAAAQTGFADDAHAAISAHVERAERFEPDPEFQPAIQDRYRWFLDVRESDAMRIKS